MPGRGPAAGEQRQAAEPDAGQDGHATGNLRETGRVPERHHARDGADQLCRRRRPFSASTGHGPANLATIRAAIIAAIKEADYLHVSEGRRDHTTPAETLRLHGFD